MISRDADEKAARERSERRRAKFSNADGQQKQVSGAYCSFALRISLLTFSSLSLFISLTKQFIRVLYIYIRLYFQFIIQKKLEKVCGIFSFIKNCSLEASIFELAYESIFSFIQKFLEDCWIIEF